MVARRPVAEVTLPPPDPSVSDSVAADVEKAARALVWPQVCCCCGDSAQLSSIPVYCPTTFGRNAAVHIPYCLRCLSHRRWATASALQSAVTVLMVGLTILLVAFLLGMLPDPILAFLLQLVLLAGAVMWGARTYFVARSEIGKAITPACSAAETPAVRFVTARPTGWRFRFFSRTYAEQFAASNRGAAIEPESLAWVVESLAPLAHLRLVGTFG